MAIEYDLNIVHFAVIAPETRTGKVWMVDTRKQLATRRALVNGVALGRASLAVEVDTDRATL